MINEIEHRVITLGLQQDNYQKRTEKNDWQP